MMVSIPLLANSLSDTFSELGCYIDKYGKPARSAGFISWECKATAYAHRGPHVLLFSPEFIEVRSIASGELVQVIEGADVRLLHTGFTQQDMLVVAMTGTIENEEGLSEKIVELTRTTALDTRAPVVRVEQLWDEWDM
jgi:RHO1 GDP-GTP exchange protein 1/2